MKEGGGGGEGRKPSILPHPLPAYSRDFSRRLCCAVFDSRSSTETLATRASFSIKIFVYNNCQIKYIYNETSFSQHKI